MLNLYSGQYRMKIAGLMKFFHYLIWQFLFFFVFGYFLHNILHLQRGINRTITLHLIIGDDARIMEGLQVGSGSRNKLRKTPGSCR